MTKQANGDMILTALDEGDSAIVVLRPHPVGGYRIVEMNSTFSRVTNYTREEALDIPLSDLHGPSTDMAIQRQMDEAMRSGKSFRGEIEYVSRVGRPFWFGFTLLSIVEPVTRCLHCVLLGRDITAKRKQDCEQSAMQAMLASVFQRVDAAVVIVRSDGFGVLANSAWHALLGYRSDELSHLTARQIAAPAYQDILAAAHARQIADGKPYKLQLALVHKDGTHVPVHLTSITIQRADMQCFRVVTVRPINEPAPQIVAPPKQSVAILGCIQFLGLDAVKDAYGPRWGSVGERLVLAAESIIKRRLSPMDVCSRTADQGFCIWFNDGTEEENAVRVTRIGREIRIMLLGELGEDAQLSVCAYAQAATIDDPTASSASVMASLSRLTAERRLEMEQQAREFLDRVIKQQPREQIHLSDRSGRVIRSSFVDLPRDLRGRFAGAMSLVGGMSADVDTGLIRLALAANAILEDVSQGRNDMRLVTIPFGLFMTRHGRDQFTEQWRSYPLSVGERLVVMLSDLPPTVGHLRTTQTAELLRSVAKRVGVMLEDVETVPMNLPTIPFTIVGLVSDSMAETSDEKLRGFIRKMHEAKARVLVRLSIAESAQRWHSLGADFTTLF
jgi:PAS domain S-box-containing protein